MHVIAAKAVAFKEALSDEFREYQKRVVLNAKVLAETLKNEGLTIVSGGTDNHLMLVDLRSVGLTGKQADQLVSGVNITANKNTIPFDPQSPFVTSGLRLGSPAMTTRGLGVAEFSEIGNILADRLISPNSSEVAADCRRRVAALCDRFPLYSHLEIPVPALTSPPAKSTDVSS
jgi:glycine hydroxymethyltransferase